MNSIEKIEVILERMVELLRFSSRDNWANALEKTRGEIKNSPDTTLAKILSMYGGMGSLNDIILYKNEQPLIAENVELDALRSELYGLCRQIQ